MKLPRYLHSWIVRHAQVALSSLGRLYRTPSASLMTAAVIAIALALPSGLYLLTGNLQRLSTQWDGNTNLSLFLHRSVSLQQAAALQKKLAKMPEIDSLQLITPEQALAEFRTLSGFGEALDVLDENPLPAVIAVKPDKDYSDADAAEALLEKLRNFPEVELAQLDLQWVRRFSAIVDIVRRSIWVMAALLGLAVLLIIGNTIRLEIQSRREEIEITKLIGATNGFIRRPFLYSGLWYGLAGAILAGALVETAFLLLYGPVSQLAGLYQSSFSLHTLSFTDSLGLLTTGAVLGLLGAWLAVGRHLAAIEPT
ncbi:MAG: permease-like cell division protein FtsX [Gammaproteobacteria bacterium]|nr:MAG: permease-like cell division protein FtsX [Gammaproteobacteria bacterium]